jgi:A/G-specific adenine glycosylase
VARTASSKKAVARGASRLGRSGRGAGDAKVGGDVVGGDSEGGDSHVAGGDVGDSDSDDAGAREQATIAGAIVAHYRRHRRDLPWRRTRDPYAVWVSEIMLQQTRVATVIPYWQRWMQRFPTVRALADAPLDDVLAAWSGLGYYRRARHLHAGAQWVAERGGALPSRAAELRAVPGVGAYTAGAVASIAFGVAAPLVDGNVARVLARVFAVDDDVKSTAGQKTIWRLAGELMAARPAEAEPGELNQGLMELGATVCTPTSPACLTCPVAIHCRARAAGRQDELPRLPARPREADLPLLATVALWVEDRGRILLAQRPATGLFAGLWELPQGADAADAAAAIGVSLAGPPAVRAHHRQTLSHRRLDITAVDARLRGRPRAVAGRYQAVRRVTLEAARSLGIASGTVALLASPPAPKPRRRDV